MGSTPRDVPRSSRRGTWPAWGARLVGGAVAEAGGAGGHGWGAGGGSPWSDAGAGVEDWLRVNFGRVEAVIVDFYHVTEHLGDLARVLYPADESTREEWLDQWCHRLKHEGGAVGAERVAQTLPLDGRETVRKVHGEVVGYFENHVHRIDYPTYRAKGWAISSGPVESACKTVIGKRMKGGRYALGQRRSRRDVPPAPLFASGEKQWDAYWHPNRN